MRPILDVIGGLRRAHVKEPDDMHPRFEMAGADTDGWRAVVRMVAPVFIRHKTNVVLVTLRRRLADIRWENALPLWRLKNTIATKLEISWTSSS